ncbi:MAG: hypothetical protein GX129_02890 [Clostridiales bacterium]|jgi:hypothetical protein|nr:hypothetical protein [Clostridiales bacterium]
MSLFPFSRNKDNSDYTKDRDDLRLAQYKEVLKRYRQSMEEYIHRLGEIDNQPDGSQISLVQTSMQLSQIQNQSEEILLILEEMRQKGSAWSQVQSEETQNQGRKALDQIESLMTTVIETNYKLEDLDKRLINNLSTVLMELHKQLLYQIKEENKVLGENYLKLQKKVRGNRGLLWVLFIFQFLMLGGIAFIILYLMDYIYF